MRDIVERLRMAASNNRIQAERGTDSAGIPLRDSQAAGKRAVADTHDEAATEIERLRKIVVIPNGFMRGWNEAIENASILVENGADAKAVLGLIMK